MKYTDRHGVIDKGKTGLSFGADETTKDLALAGVNGILWEIDIEIPAFTNAVTASVKFIRGNYVEKLAENLAKNDNHEITLDHAVTGQEILRIELSGVPGGAGGTVYVTPILA